ncbi:MAG TPA: PHP domain-containing protein [Candidatus Limnocylindria bacterium]|nr:PHP domain-containing protein [Candidatus Limnocylindria bacterium]
MGARFAELHCHSNFSFLDGASPLEDLVERAAELGMGALGLADHGGLYGAVRFASAAQEAGLAAVVGTELELLDAAVPDPDQVVVPRRRGRRRAEQPAEQPAELQAGDVAEGRVKPPNIERLRPPAHRQPRREDLRGVRARELGAHLVLLARDLSGYRSLCRLTSAAQLSGTKGVPRFTHELLGRHTEGLLALSGCRQGELARRLLVGDREGAAAAARRLADLFPGAFYLELQHHLLPDDDWLVAETVALADRLGLPVVVTNDVHYARPADRELQDVLVCIRHGATLEESAHLRRPNGEYYLKSEAELAALPPGRGELGRDVRRAWLAGLRTAGELAARCGIDLDFEQYRFPGFPVPRTETPFSYLETLCHDGARARYRPMTPAVVKQLAHELEVIERTGLAEFFLICWDLMRFCRERRIPAQGRGSAGDSIVAYVLGITRVDPIRHRLLFERFINEGRTVYPDVDIDFATSRREEVIQYCYERYGEEHTGMVCNLVTYRARSAVREVGYALGFPRPLVDRVAKALETYDSVMVRRDLEAEGGFAEFFRAPQAEAGAVDAARAAQMLDAMGRLRSPAPPRGASDDEGGPGDTPVSVRWLRGEADAGGRVPAEGRVPAGDRASAGGPLAEDRASAEGRPPAGGRPATDDYRPPALSERLPTPIGSVIPPPFLSRRAGADNDSLESSRSAEPELDRLSPSRDTLSRGVEAGEPRAKAGPNGADTAGVKNVEHKRALKPSAGAGVPSAGAGVPSAGAGVPSAGAGVPSAGAGVPSAAAKSPVPAEVVSAGAAETKPQPRHGSTVGLSAWERWLELTARIDGFPRHLSIHTGGMLITQAPLVDIAPLERATMPGRVVVQYDKRDIETIKLIKLDLLGLRMLSAIDDALRDIAADCAVHVNLDRLPEDIPDVFRMIQAADTVGVFQIESRAQMQTLPRSRPETLDDLVVEVAIIRPGPIQGNAVHPYLRRRQGKEEVSYLHPSLQPALEETLGVILYQEQVMKIAIDVAGFSPAESDGFRRAMGTWRSSREMEKLHARFVEGCITRNGLTTEQAEELFRQVAAFASFGFNKSHAAAFARTAYESAFLKLFYPAQFVTGLINAQPMGFYPVEVLINDAKRHGTAVLPVDINRSRFRSTTEWVGLPGTPLPEDAGIDRRPAVVRSSGCVVPSQQARDRWAAPTARAYGIRLGLHLVKGIGETEGEAVDAEVAARGPFRSLADLVARTELPEELVERLIRAGALDSLGEPRRRLLWQLREVAGSARGRYDGRSVGSKKTAGRPLDLRLPPTQAPDLPPPTEIERLGDAYAILSLDARRQVVELFRPALDRLGVMPAGKLTDARPGNVRIGGLVVTRQHPMTARGTVFLALEDETGMVNVTLWPDTWARFRGTVRRHALLYVEGRLERESDVVNVIARRVVSLVELCRPAGGPQGPTGVRQLGHAGMRRLG